MNKVKRIQNKPKLFIVSPTNSGSTILYKLLGSADNASKLPQEGRTLMNRQRTENGLAAYPDERDWNMRAFTEHAKEISDPGAYDWPMVKQVWANRWIKHTNHDPEVLIEKSPSNVYRVDMLDNNFDNSHFLMLFREPAAIVEGHIRRGNISLDAAIYHVDRCYQLMSSHLDRNDLSAMEVWYGEMVHSPETVVERINERFDGVELGGIDTDQEWRVHNIENEMEELKDMNLKQIDRLSPAQIRTINRAISL